MVSKYKLFNKLVNKFHNKLSQSETMFGNRFLEEVFSTLGPAIVQELARTPKEYAILIRKSFTCCFVLFGNQL